MYPFPHFRYFTFGTPTIPDIYWNSYSYEERIKKLCCEYHKLIHFVDAMVDTVNSQYVMIEDMKDELAEIVSDTIKNDPEVNAQIMEKVDAYLDSVMVGTTYKQINEHGFVYDAD